MTKIDEFVKIIDNIYWLYLDSISSFNITNIRFSNFQIDFSKRNWKTIKELDLRDFNHWKGEFFKGKVLHKCTQWQFKERTKINGHNSNEIWILCIGMIYNYWEDFYREEIAKEKGVSKNDIISEIMGDLRILRISITHNRWIATNKITNTKIIKWINSWEKINISNDQFEEIIDAILIDMSNLNK